MISKELLSEVLGINIQEVDVEFISRSFSESVIRYYSNGKDYLINIYELAHKCKEWAFKHNDFILQSAYVPKGKFTSTYCIAEKNFSYPTIKETFHANTEPESIFKACQWILDNTKDEVKQ